MGLGLALRSEHSGGLSGWLHAQTKQARKQMESKKRRSRRIERHREVVAETWRSLRT